MTQPRLLLASASPRRRELLGLLGLPYEVTVTYVRETPAAEETPGQLVVRLSRAKAREAGLDGYRDALVIACDTVVALGDDILGKPATAAEARAMLRRLCGRSHLVYSAVTALVPGGDGVTELARSGLTMRAYTEAQISAYVASGDPMDKAGAYAIQHEGFDPVDRIEGCYASVMGLPLCHLARGLRHLGVEPRADVPAACQDHTGRRCTAYQEIKSRGRRSA